MTNLTDYRAEQIAYEAAKRLAQPELKPCPCCRGKAYLEQYPDAPEYFAIVRCSKCDIRAVKDTDEEAIEAWNNRAERTCEMFQYRNALGLIDEYQCSECGADVEGKPNYCPNCGARVDKVVD